ncbi:hypothetical protein QBC47DRAFT_380817 [Echria macrotheca]|uniref:Smr domain-containing protein n=1 Tax=Echria macrotheca TaxID=438768 RepID=A0AAJ0FBQ9_9PEZI|nr:hypothetical protein QBC47DRAFT_380817 [Echria macrotheca]
MGRRPRRQRAGAEDLRQQLIDKYSSLLEESLILAILNERDVVKDFSDIDSELSQLAESAAAEQATGFDPSGLGSWNQNGGQTSEDVGTSASVSGLERSSTGNATSVSEFSVCEDPEFTHRSDLGEDEKITELGQIFSFRPNTIRHVLNGCQGDMERAFDELLTRHHLEENGELPKGVDGFYVSDEDISRSRPSGRSRKKKGKQLLDVRYNVVSSVTAGEEIEGGSGPAQPKAKPSPYGSKMTFSSTSSTWIHVTSSTSGTRRAAIPDLAASREHLRSAAKLVRRGPLERQGAAAYTQMAQEERRKALEKTSAAAEQLVDEQSSPVHIDLHGVTVMDGVLIARDRLWKWWHGLGEERRRLAKQEGFTVVTGRGRHSVNGDSRLRQAVGVALRNDGWKVETLTGQFHVTGRVQ